MAQAFRHLRHENAVFHHSDEEERERPKMVLVPEYDVCAPLPRARSYYQIRSAPRVGVDVVLQLLNAIIDGGRDLLVGVKYQLPHPFGSTDVVHLRLEPIVELIKRVGKVVAREPAVRHARHKRVHLRPKGARGEEALFAKSAART